MNLKERLDGKKILVTGAGGFLGSHLVESLIEKGASVRAFLRYTSKNDLGNLTFLPKETLNEVERYFGDVRDFEAVRNASKDCDLVFHLAANIAIPYSYQHPGDTISTNVTGTFNVLTAAREVGVERILVVSTSEVYGTAQTDKIAESHPLVAQSPYSASKIGAEKLAESFYLSFGLPVTVVRPFNAYGPRQSCRAVTPTIIRQLFAGDRISLGDPTPTRDLNYCTDLAEGMIAACVCEASVGQVINLGTGVEISIGDLAQKIGKLLGRDIKIVQDERRMRPSKSEVRRLCCDNSKALEILGWQPTTTLDDGLMNTVEWFSGHQEDEDSFRL